MENSRTQIIATIGPVSKNISILKEMISNNMDIARLNFSWGTHDDHKESINNIREVGKNLNKNIPIIQDLSGPRIQQDIGHTYEVGALEIITEKDLYDLKFGIEQNIEYIAMSFVGYKKDVEDLRNYIKDFGGNQKIISKIERQVAFDNIDEIIEVSDGIMVARGDLGNEVPLEQIPFIEKTIIEKCNSAKKPVIVATQMMLSMTENTLPTRAEVTDVSFAVLEGTDAVMLSEESASGKHPVEVITMMEKILKESEKHTDRKVIKL
jgi:pyruvate kinase